MSGGPSSSHVLQDFLHDDSMYLGFFGHSPRAAHCSQRVSASTQAPQPAFCVSADWPKGPTCIHLVADHFSPFVVGQLPCKLEASVSPSGFSLHTPQPLLSHCVQTIHCHASARKVVMPPQSI